MDVTSRPTDATESPADLTIAAARRELDAGRLSAVELTAAVLDRVAALNPRHHAYLHVDRDSAIEQARVADLTGRDDLPLRGIPLCVKDIIDVAGMPVTAGAAGWRREPDQDAEAVARLRAAGAVIIGMGNTNEFAYGADGLNPHRGDAANPYDPALIAGGSSSGPAVATATGMALAGVGTDTSGSVRIPAALCGLVGIRPTLGLVPRTGVIPLAWSYDAVGPLTRTVEDAALLLAVMAADPALILRDMPPGSLAGFRLGLIDDLVEIAEPYVAEGVAAATAALEAAGARVVSCRPELLQHTRAMHYVVQQAEAARVHAPWFASQQEHYAPQVRRRIEAGQRVSATDYLAAQQARRLFIDAVSRAMTGLDALLAPTVPMVAAPRTEAELTIRGRRLTVREALLQCTIPFTQLGSPVVTVPIGAHEGLPYGLQIAGRPSAERVVLRIAAACEQRWPWAARRPTPWRQ